MKYRINDIEFKKNTSSKTKKPLYEIVKWQINKHYGKEQEYRDKGYVDSFGDFYLQKGCSSIQKSFFTLPETCYVIAFIEKEKDNWELKSVGERMLDLTPEEWEDFHKVYTLGQTKLNKKK